MADTKRFREPKHIYNLPFELAEIEAKKKRFVEDGGVRLTDADKAILKREGFIIELL